jgi:hypothetical protein
MGMTRSTCRRASACWPPSASAPRFRRSGNLVQQRLKKVMIAPVNQDDVDRGIAQVLDQVQTSETTAHSRHALPLRGRSGGLDRWSHLPSLWKM